MIFVSCICPTSNRRHNRHAQLYKCFTQQRYPYKELLLLDDPPFVSGFFGALKDYRVIYRSSPIRLSVGAKRNTLIKYSHGNVIVHFDDDDYYQPTYLSEMVGQLRTADFVKLSVFNIVDEKNGTRRQVDTRSGILANESTQWGYGFSYAYRKSVWNRVKFPDLNLREDLVFVNRIRENGFRLRQVADYPHLVLHTIHDDNTSMMIV
jgi:glycosyltransferase involved in cell wall biosynthesis